MTHPLVLTAPTQQTAGILLILIVTIEYGGWFMLRVVRGGQAATDFQKAFFRAGHAHAGVLVILALVCQVLAGSTHLGGLPGFLAQDGVPLAAILVPAGFFLSAAGREATRPNRLIVLLYVGMVSLGAGVLSLGLGLLTA
jgi:hypothetical protein